MKVNIGPYKSHFRMWKYRCNYLELAYGEDWYDVPEEQFNCLDIIITKTCDLLDKYIFDPFYNKVIKRKTIVKYHNYDTWSLDHTLAIIILPGLKQLKETNHGYAMVDSEDLPTACLKDASGEERWEWVMDEMIWAFTEIANEYPGEEAFYSGETDIKWLDAGEGLKELSKGPNHTFSVDFEGRKKYNDRIQRGLILFGKYYRSLWD